MTRRPSINLGGVDPVAFASARAALETPQAWSPPSVLPPLWDVHAIASDGGRYVNATQRLVAILSCARELDGRLWLHLSLSHEARLPKWGELVEAKELFLGNREAYKVIPPRERYVNIHPNVLHLFALLDERETALPDFTHGTGSL